MAAHWEGCCLFDEIYIETIRAEICYTYIYQQNVCRVIPTKQLTLEDINIFETEVQIMNKRQYLHSQNKENGTDHNRANQIKKCL